MGDDSVDATKPDGWHPWPLCESHVMRDALYINGLARAVVEAFSDRGPWYANALTPEGQPVRLGPGITLERAIAWCEVTTGHRVKVPALGGRNAADG